MLTRNNPLVPRPLPPDRRTKRASFARAVGSFVPKVAGKAFEKFGFHTSEILTQWPRIAGAEIAQWSRPERIRWARNVSGVGIDQADTSAGGGRPGGTLVLRVEPARALDVEYRTGEIIDRINRYFGYRAVETLKIIQAPLAIDEAKAAAPDPTLNFAGAGKNRQNPAAPSLPHLGQPLGQPQSDLVELSQDEGLKAALERLWASVSRKT